MHAINDKPVAINGKVEIRPIMVVALTYDHRLLDGREAVTFLGTCTVDLCYLFSSRGGSRLTDTFWTRPVSYSEGETVPGGPAEDAAQGLDPRISSPYCSRLSFTFEYGRRGYIRVA